jgi:hypothetical protein
MLASLDWAEGKDVEMEKHLQSLAASPPGELVALGFRSSLAATRGQMRKAHEFSHQMEDAMDRLRLKGRADSEAGLAGADALVGNNSAALAEANGALRTSHTLNVQFSRPRSRRVEAGKGSQ